MRTVRILVADDHYVVRRGLRALLESRRRWKICGEAVSGVQAVSMARHLKPDLVILDISMPEISGLEATRQILRALPQTQILILSMHESEQVVREVLEAGARGYVAKSDADRDLVAAVESLSDGRLFFTSKVAQLVLERFLKSTAAASAAHDRLTPRERQIVCLLADGKSNKEVASALGISVKTAENHRTHLMQKLGIHSIAELVRYAIRQKLVEP